MRKFSLIPLLLVAILALAACGGGGSSSSAGSGTTAGGSASEEGTSGESAATTPEGKWAEEVTAVMTEFENKVTPTVIEPIHTSTAKQHLEPLYAVYSVDLRVLAKKLEETKAPAACVANRKKMAEITGQVAALTKSLSSQVKANAKLDPEQYAAKSYQQGLKIDKLGHELGALTAKPHC